MAQCSICGKRIGMLAANPCTACITEMNEKHEAELRKQKSLDEEIAQQKQRKQEQYSEQQEERKESMVDQIRSGKKIGRNEPCSCGSGKKFKHCCGAL